MKFVYAKCRSERLHKGGYKEMMDQVIWIAVGIVAVAVFSASSVAAYMGVKNQED